MKILDRDLITQVIEVQRLAWRRDDYSLIPPTVFKTLATHGGVLYGAVTPKNQVIGYVFGFPALGKNLFLYHHSHQIGVIPGHQNQGIGTALKKAQLNYCKEISIPVMTWTYDQLVGANSHVNYTHLHTLNRTYHVNYYGERSDIYNAELETDRFEVELWINPSIEADLISLKKQLHEKYKSQDIQALWKFSAKEFPQPEQINVEVSRDEKAVFIPIPGDFLLTKSSDIERLRKWRLLLRVASQQLIAKKFVCIDFWRSNNPQIPSSIVWVRENEIPNLPPKFLEDS